MAENKYTISEVCGGENCPVCNSPKGYEEEKMANTQSPNKMYVTGSNEGATAPSLPTAETGVDLIAAERKRQIEHERWSPQHDARHKNGEIALAAIAYASPLPVKVQGYVASNANCGCREAICPHTSPFGVKKWVDPWPWDAEWDKRKKHDPIRKLVIAGALIAAEIDRLKRLSSDKVSKEHKRG